MLRSPTAWQWFDFKCSTYRPSLPFPPVLRAPCEPPGSHNNEHTSRMAAGPADRVWFTLDTASKPVGPYTVQEIAGELLGCGAAVLFGPAPCAGRS